MGVTAVSIFWGMVSICIFTVWVQFAKEIYGVSKGENPLGSGFPIGASSISVGTRFCLQSLVCYTFCDRWRKKGVVPGCYRQFQGSAEQADFACWKLEKIGFAVGKIGLFVCRWWGKSCGEAERFSASPGSQEVYKKFFLSQFCAINYYGNSSRTLSKAVFSVDFALLSDRWKCFAVSVKGCSMSSSNPKRNHR